VSLPFEEKPSGSVPPLILIPTGPLTTPPFDLLPLCREESSSTALGPLPAPFTGLYDVTTRSVSKYRLRMFFFYQLFSMPPREYFPFPILIGFKQHAHAFLFSFLPSFSVEQSGFPGCNLAGLLLIVTLTIHYLPPYSCVSPPEREPLPEHDSIPRLFFPPNVTNFLLKAQFWTILAVSPPASPLSFLNGCFFKSSSSFFLGMSSRISRTMVSFSFALSQLL